MDKNIIHIPGIPGVSDVPFFILVKESVLFLISAVNILRSDSCLSYSLLIYLNNIMTDLFVHLSEIQLKKDIIFTQKYFYSPNKKLFVSIIVLFLILLVLMQQTYHTTHETLTTDFSNYLLETYKRDRK